VTREEMQELSRMLAKDLADELRKPRFGWNSTGSSWIRAHGAGADAYTDSPMMPPETSPSGGFVYERKS